LHENLQFILDKLFKMQLKRVRRVSSTNDSFVQGCQTYETTQTQKGSVDSTRKLVRVYGKLKMTLKNLQVTHK
jgi:hypothetical protein